MTKNKNQAVIPASALSRVLTVVSRGAGRDGLYEMVQVDVRDGTLTAQCFNGTMGVSVQTAVEDHGSGIGAMVNAQAFVSLASSMNCAATLTQEARKGLKVECDSVSVSLKGTQTGELPGLDSGRNYPTKHGRANAESNQARPHPIGCNLLSPGGRFYRLRLPP